MALDDKFNSFITEGTVKGSSSGRLSGLRVGIKDNIDVGGMKTTAASRILADNVAKSNADVVDRLLSQGATVIGKTNMHEFAIGATTTSTAAGPCRNPRDRTRICGGSSGGSAAAVAAGIAEVALGTDTGGSVRLPAALCGVVGFKPTTGSVSAEGVVPLSRTLDAVGILSGSIAQARAVFDVICSRREAAREWSGDAEKAKIGLYLFGSDQVSAALGPFLKRAGKLCSMVRMDIPELTARGPGTRRAISSAEAARYHEKWMEERRADYFRDVLSVLEWGKGITDEIYSDALNDLAVLREIFEEKMKDFDVILTPAVREVAPPIKEVVGKEREYRRLLGITELFNATGTPSVSIPAAEADGLPAGLLVTGAFNQDMRTLAVAEMLMGIVAGI